MPPKRLNLFIWLAGKEVCEQPVPTARLLYKNIELLASCIVVCLRLHRPRMITAHDISFYFSVSSVPPYPTIDFKFHYKKYFPSLRAFLQPSLNIVSCGGQNRTGVVWLMRPSWNHLQSTPQFGARNGTRTRDLDLGKVTHYQLCYSRIWSRIRESNPHYFSLEGRCHTIRRILQL